MQGILWNSAEEKEREWLFAKEKLTSQGKLLPNGTKLRRKDHFNTLNHSFMIMDGQIIALSGKGIHLGSGRDAHAKLAENEAGNLIALKIITSDGRESNSVRESHIAYDLEIAGERVTRSSISSTKHYIAYQYLGTLLTDYLHANKSLSLDKRYELCIKIALALHEIHIGKQTKSKKGYQHNDIHWGNVVIDYQEEPHFIDFGKASEADGNNIGDIVSMLLLFFTPIKDRQDRHESWIFGDWVGEYQFVYSRPDFDPDKKEYDLKNQTIYIYLNPDDKNAEDAYSIIHYAVSDPSGIFHEGSINLSDICLDNITPQRKQLRWFDLEEDKRILIEKEILKITNHKGYTLSQENKNETLFNLLKKPTAFYEAPKVPTALDIAETLTVCRLQLEAYQDLFKTQSLDVRLEIIQILNSISPELLKLYEQLRILPSSDNLTDLVKKYIFAHLLTSPKEPSEDSLDFLNLPLDEMQTIKQCVDNILININHAREAWGVKNTPLSHDEPDHQQRPQSKSPDVIELEAPSIEIEEVIAIASPAPSKPQDPIPVIHEEMNTKNPTNPAKIVSEPNLSACIVLHESEKFVTQDDQTHTEYAIPQAERDFLRELKNLQHKVEEQHLASAVSSMTIKQKRAQKAALNEANQVIKEIRKQLPLAENDERLQSSRHNEALLIQLADICSHTTHGLHFVANGRVSFLCDMFDATNNTSGALRQVNYDMNQHRLSMDHLSNMASSLEGSGWKKLRNTLFVLAGLMLIACGILAVIPTGGTSLLLGLSSTAVLTAGIGFFVGRDTGMAGSVSNLQMKVPP